MKFSPPSSYLTLQQQQRRQQEEARRIQEERAQELRDQQEQRRLAFQKSIRPVVAKTIGSLFGAARDEMAGNWERQARVTDFQSSIAPIRADLGKKMADLYGSSQQEQALEMINAPSVAPGADPFGQRPIATAGRPLDDKLASAEILKPFSLEPKQKEYLLRNFTSQQLNRMAQSGSIYSVLASAHKSLDTDIGSQSYGPSGAPLPGVLGDVGITLPEAASIVGSAPSGGLFSGAIGQALGTTGTQVAVGDRPIEALPIDAAAALGGGLALKGAGRLVGAGLNRGARGATDIVTDPRVQSGARRFAAEELGGTRIPGGDDFRVGDNVYELSAGSGEPIFNGDIVAIEGAEAVLQRGSRTKRVPLSQLQLEKRSTGAVRIPGGGTTPPEPDAATKLMNLVRAAKPARAETEALRHAELGRRAGRASEILAAGRGEEAFRAARAPLKGELPVADFTPPRTGLEPKDVTELFERIRLAPDLQYFTKQNTSSALTDLLAGKIPTRSESALLQRVFGKQFVQAIESQRPLSQRAWQETVDAANLPRSVVASADVSFPFRQGVMVGPRHPKEFFGNLPALFRALGPKRFSEAADQAIRRDEYFKYAEQGRLYMAPLDDVADIAAREESFASNLATRIPLLGQIVKASQRSFVTYGNKLRFDIFKNTIKGWEKAGKPFTTKDVRELADLLNKMTGRGDLGPFNQASGVLSAGFFSPRFAVSRPQAVWKLFSPNTTPLVRKLAAEEIVSFVGTGITILSLAKLSGAADVNLDPRSSDFGKIKIGKQRIDFWGSNQQLAVAVARLIDAKTVTSNGIEIPQSRVDTVLNFVRNKLSPQAGLITDIAVGETSIGEELETTGEGIRTQAWNRLTPLALQDIVDAIREEGLRGGLVAGLLAPLGVGVQTYETAADRKEQLYNQRVEEGAFGPGALPYDEEVTTVRSANIAQDPELSRMATESESEFGEITEQTSAPLEPVAQEVNANAPTAGERYREARKGQLAIRTALREQLGDFGETGNAILDEYFSLDLPVGATREEEQAFFQRRDELLTQMPERIRDAVTVPERTFAGFPEIIEAEKRYQKALDAYKLYRELPKYKGLSVEEGDQVDQITRDIMYVRLQSGQDLETFNATAAFQEIKGRYDAKIERWYEENMLPAQRRRRSGGLGEGIGGSLGQRHAAPPKPSMQDPRRDQLLLRNPDMAYFALVNPSSLTLEMRAQLPPYILQSGVTPELQ